MTKVGPMETTKGQNVENSRIVKLLATEAIRVKRKAEILVITL